MLKYPNRIITGNGTVVDLDQLLYIKANNNGVIFHLQDGKWISDWKSLNHFSNTLSDHPDFFQVHRSYIVKRNHIKKIKANQLLLSDGSIVPIGITQKSKVHEWIQK